MKNSDDLPYRPFELHQWAELIFPKLYQKATAMDVSLETQLQQQNNFLWDVMNNSHNVSIICLDRSYRYLFFNRLHHQRMKSMLNADIELGCSLLDYLPDAELFEQVKSLLDHALSGETVNDVQSYASDTDDRSFFDSVYSPMLNDQGKIMGVIITATDVTLTKRKEESLRQAHEELEERVAKRTAELQQTNEKLRSQISDRGHFEQTIRENEERFRSTFEQSATAIVLTDQALSIQYGNQAFCQLAGYEIDEMMGQPLLKLLGISDQKMAPFWQQLPLEPGHVWQTETPIERKDGRSSDVSISVTAVYDAEGELLEYVVQLSNVSLRRQLERAQQQFITNTSHELRTPLTNIRLYLQLLEKRPENQPKYLRVLNREVSRLQTLLDDIMEITSLTASGGATSWQAVSAPMVLESAVNPFRRKAVAKKLSLEIAPIDTSIPVVSGDPARLTQALGEIVENATNFTPPGGKIVAMIGTEEKDGRQWVKMSVQDTGSGIPADEQPYVFERFFRGGMSESGNIPGTGLGLSIAEAIVKAHGGRIIVESLVGMGSTFTVFLPVIK
jgi:PAS domain S-box-containing protein